MTFKKIVNVALQSLKWLPSVLQKSLLYLVVWTLPFCLMSQYFATLQNLPDERLRYLSIAGSMLSSVAVAAVFVLIVPVVLRDLLAQKKNPGAPRTSLRAHFSKHLSQLAIESLRVFGKCSLWTLALVLPGIYTFFRLYFVAYIVQFSEKYQAGQIDALEESRRLTKGPHFWGVSLVIVVSAGLSFFIQWETSKESLFENPAMFVVGYVLNLLVATATEVMNYRMYEVLEKE